MNQYFEKIRQLDEKLIRLRGVDEHLKLKLYKGKDYKDFPVFEGVTYKTQEEVFERMRDLKIELGSTLEKRYREEYGIIDDLDLAGKNYEEALNLRNEKNLKNNEEVNLEEKVDNLRKELCEVIEENRRRYWLEKYGIEPPKTK